MERSEVRAVFRQEMRAQQKRALKTAAVIYAAAGLIAFTKTATGKRAYKKAKQTAAELKGSFTGAFKEGYQDIMHRK